MNRPTNTDLGVTLINKVYDDMKIDAKWTVWEPRGFTWWGWGSAQRVWSEPPVNDDGFPLYRLHARSEIFDGFENTDPQVMVLSLLGMHATLSGAVQAPNRPGGIDLAASVYAHEENLSWTRPLFSIAVAMQAAEAAILMGQAIELKAGLRPALSAHPEAGPRAEMDEMLDIIKNLVNPEGRGPSRYAGPEMKQLLATFQQPPCVIATGDKAGITAEYPYPGHTSLLRLSTTERNPRAGSGLLALLTVPEGKDDAATARQALEWNEKELCSLTRTHFLGSWCISETGLTYATFYPNCIYRNGCLMNIAMTNVLRAQWLTQDIFGFDMREHFEEARSHRMALARRSRSPATQPTPKGVLRRLFGRKREQPKSPEATRNGDDLLAHPLLRTASLKYSEGSIEQMLVLRFLSERCIAGGVASSEDCACDDATLATWVREARSWAEAIMQTEPQTCAAMFEAAGDEALEGVRQLLLRELGSQPSSANDERTAAALITWARRGGFEASEYQVQNSRLLIEVVDAALWLGWLFPRNEN